MKNERGGRLRKLYPKVPGTVFITILKQQSVSPQFIDSISRRDFDNVHLDLLRSKCGVFENEVAGRVKPKS